MKKLLLHICRIFYHKAYRRRIGGTWYQVIDTGEDMGLAGSAPFWTQEPGDLPVFKEEKY